MIVLCIFSNYACVIFRLHQVHVLDPRWCEVPLDMKTNIYSTLKLVENIVKDDAANFKEFGYLQATHYNAWKGKDVQPILSGKPDFKSTGNDEEC